MRWRRRHLWGAILLVLFALPVVQPAGFDLVERPVGALFHWFARVPLLNPHLLSSPGGQGSGGHDEILEREVLELWEHVFEIRSRWKQAEDLGRALRLEEGARLPRALLCRVLRARDPVPFRRSLLLDRGRADGLVEGLPVVAGNVYLGRIAVVAGHTALVQLVTDRQARAEVFVRADAGRPHRGFTRRGGERDGLDFLRLDFVRSRASEGRILAGAPVVTANFDPLVPAGLLVGRVAQVSDPDHDALPQVEVEPAFVLDALTEAVVLLTHERLRSTPPATARPPERARSVPPIEVPPTEEPIRLRRDTPIR